MKPDEVSTSPFVNIDNGLSVCIEDRGSPFKEGNAGKTILFVHAWPLTHKMFVSAVNDS